MAYTHTIFPGFVPEGYYDEDNIIFIGTKVMEILKREYSQNILIDRGSISRVMERVLSERIETIPRMNRRVIMYLANEFRNHQKEVQKHLKWEEHFVLSQRPYDPSTAKGIDTQKLKMANRLGKPRVGATSRFYFT